MGIGEHSLQAETRDEKASAAVLRSRGVLPAVVYGKGLEPVAIQVDARLFKKLYQKAGESSLINLTIAGQPDRVVLVRDSQYDPRTGEMTHADLYQVNLTEKIRAEVPLTFEGEAPAVEAFDGILVTNKDSIEVECLPSDLPREIKVDLSGLANIDDAIFVKDLTIPAGVEVLDDMEESVAVVNEQREEEPEVAVSEAEAVESVEVTTEKREEDAGGATESAKE